MSEESEKETKETKKDSKSSGLSKVLKKFGNLAKKLVQPKVILIVLLLGFGAWSLFLANFVFADGDHDVIFEQAKELIESRVSCDELTDDQFEIIGEYFMELMHPGELHEIMDARLGGEGSGSLRLAHINIGKMQYCGEFAGSQGYGWMMGSGMMYGDNSQGMFGNHDGETSNYGWMEPGMMFGNYGRSYGVFGWITRLLVIIALVLLILWLYKKVRKTK